MSLRFCVRPYRPSGRQEGNLFVVGSIANIIVIDQAARLNIRIGWREHARIGVPVTRATLAIAAGWLLVLA
jgi:Na+/H+ antiporter NhaD/arsenite permease-like protein